jgi:hypothetical protein
MRGNLRKVDTGAYDAVQVGVCVVVTNFDNGNYAAE